jgi:hypothetical protein
MIQFFNTVSLNISSPKRVAPSVTAQGHFFQAGRVVAIINKPQPGPLSKLVFGGPDLQTLYVTSGDKVFRRTVRRKGVFSWTPVKPPQPRL